MVNLLFLYKMAGRDKGPCGFFTIAKIENHFITKCHVVEISTFNGKQFVYKYE